MNKKSKSEIVTSCAQIHKDNLTLALKLTGPFVAKRSTLPILSNVLLMEDAGRLAVVATNLDGYIAVYVGAMVDGGFALTVSHKTLSDVVSILDGLVVLAAETEYNLTESGQRKGDPTMYLLLSSQIMVDRKSKKTIGQKNTLPAISADEFPIRQNCDYHVATMPGSELARLINNVKHAAAKDDSRPILTGGNLEIYEGHVTLAAADGFRLTVDTTRDVRASESGKYIVPMRILAEVAKAIEAVDAEEVTISARIEEELRPKPGQPPKRTATQLCFDLGTAKIIAQLVDGNYPNYHELIPANRPVTVEFSGAEMLAATKVGLAMMKSADIERCKLSIVENELTLSTKSVDTGNNQVTMPVSIQGAYSVEFSINMKYLQDAVGKRTGLLRMEFCPGSPVVTIVDESALVETLMPMFNGSTDATKAVIILAEKPVDVTPAEGAVDVPAENEEFERARREDEVPDPEAQA